MPNTALIAGRYRIVRSLGKGGYAEVHEVVDESTGARVALKQLLPEDAAKDIVRELFRREFNTLAQLAHPLIVRVFDYGVDGTPYYTMELISGAHLSGPIAWPEACALLRDVASALSLVHSRRLVHRDVTHRNVYKTEDGHAKLFDFGALTPMGLTTELVGTPAYIPPEAVTEQRLDARSDLFSLGGLGYLILTGRHAFPARRLGDLGEVWGRTVEAPSHFAADVPRSLDELILALLSRNPIARPASAAEVFNRLTAIAALPAAEAPEVAQAYLSTPALVGRTEADRQFRNALARCRRGKGSSLLLEGARGLGRSRLLSSFLLDAKLDGLLTARVEPGASEPESLAFARALWRQLESAEPVMLRDAARPHDEFLSPLLQDDSAVSPDRVPSVVDALVATICSLSRAKPLVIGVDDFERADVPSKQLIIRLAKAAPSSTLMLVVALVQDVTTEAHVLLRDLSSAIVLTPLSASDTNELTKSLFGEVAHVETIGSWIHRLSQGTPRTALEAATHLVDAGIARFEEGSWVLPGRLDELALPASIDQTLDARVALLGTDARRFCQALALSSEEDPLHAQEYGELLPGVSGARLDAVFDELFSRGILVPPASSPAFVHEGLRDAVRRSIPGSEVPEVHRRVASAYRSGSAPSLVLSAYHSLEAGDTELGFAEGARAVHRRATISIRGAAFLRTEEGTRAFERLFEWGLATKKPWPDVLSIGQMLLTNAAVADARLVRHREPVIARLRLDSGLSDWEALSEIPDPVQRIQMAVGNAFMRHQSTPETERGLSPPEAIEMLCGAVAGLCGFFARRLEHTEVVALLPLLEPFRLLSPAVGAVADMLDTTVDSMVGRCVTERRKRVMRALSSPIPGLEEVPRIGMWWLNLYYQALDDACYGRPGAADPVHPLLSTAMYAPLAWDARLMAALYQGDLEGAEAARKERELSKLTRSDGAHAQLEGGFVYEVSAYDFLGDVLQLKRCLPRLERRAHERPATRSRYVLQLGNYYRLRGQLQKAIAAYEEALALTPSPAVSVDWAYIVMRYAHTLVDVGRAAEARDLCVRAVAEATAFGFMPRIARYMEMKLALAEAALGLSRAAAERSERIIEEAISEGIGGVHFAHLCLDQALAAQLARDEEFLERAISRLERLAANSKYPAFAMKHAHLLRLAQGRGRFQVAPNPPKPLGAWEMIPTAVAASHRTQLELCKGRGERAQRALRILLEAAASDEGYLYLIGDDGITLAASRAGSGPPASLEESLTERVRAGSVEAATTDETTQMPSLRPEAPSSYDVVEVVTDSGGRYVLAALAAMKPRNGALLPVPMTVRTTLSDALIRAGDTVAIPWT